MLSKFFPLALLVIFMGSAATAGCRHNRPLAYLFGAERRQTWLGVTVKDVTRQLKEKENLTHERGAYVTEVAEESPAEKAGLKEGDVIVKLGEKVIDNSSDLLKAVRREKPGSEVKIEAVRNKENKTFTAKLSRLKAPRAFSFNFKNIPQIPRVKPFGGGEYDFRFFSFHEFYGLGVQDLTKQLSEFFEVPKGGGVLVSEVKKGSAAEKALFKAGDVITKVGDRKVRDVGELRSEISDISGKEITFEVIRKGKTVNLSMQIEKSDDEDDYSLRQLDPGSKHEDMMFQLGIAPEPEIDILMDELNDMQYEIKGRVRGLPDVILDEL